MENILFWVQMNLHYSFTLCKDGLTAWSQRYSEHKNPKYDSDPDQNGLVSDHKDVLFVNVRGSISQNLLPDRLFGFRQTCTAMNFNI